MQKKLHQQVYGVKHNAGLWAFISDPAGMMRSPDYAQPMVPASASELLRNGFGWYAHEPLARYRDSQAKRLGLEKLGGDVQCGGGQHLLRQRGTKLHHPGGDVQGDA